MEKKRSGVVVLPVSALEALENARIDLFRLLEDSLKSMSFKIALLEITSVIWEVANRKYWFEQVPDHATPLQVFDDWRPWSEEGMKLCMESTHGFILRLQDGSESEILPACPGMMRQPITHYFLCNPILPEGMVERWRKTGQPVWVKYDIKDDFGEYAGTVVYATNNPDWRIKDAIYSFSALGR